MARTLTTYLETGSRDVAALVRQLADASLELAGPVSYTHLTLPTILLV